MADKADIAADNDRIYMAMNIKKIRDQVKPYTTGACIECGAHSERLLRQTCVSCRDYQERLEARKLGKYR